MVTLYTLVVMFGSGLTPNLPPVLSNHTTAHLSYDTCQVMAQREREQGGGGFFIPIIRCLPDDEAEKVIAEAKSAYQQATGLGDGPALYTLHGNITVDGRSIPEMVYPHLTWDQCQSQIAQAESVVAAQHGRGTIRAACVKE